MYHILSPLFLLLLRWAEDLKGLSLELHLTHWPSLARVIRAEVMQIRSAPFVQLSQKMGKSRWWIAIHHILPHLVPQILVGFMLLFPHTILHEAAITFLGLGLSAHTTSDRDYSVRIDEIFVFGDVVACFFSRALFAYHCSDI